MPSEVVDDVEVGGFPPAGGGAAGTATSPPAAPKPTHLGRHKKSESELKVTPRL